MKSAAALLLAGALLFAGCATTPDQRIAQDRAAFDSLPPGQQSAVRAGRVEPGFPPAAVRLAFGTPDRTATRTTAEGVEEIWSYRLPRSGLTIGLGVGGSSGRVGYGTSVILGDTGGSEEALRVVFRAGVVATVEETRR